MKNLGVGVINQKKEKVKKNTGSGGVKPKKKEKRKKKNLRKIQTNFWGGMDEEASEIVSVNII